jgi:hypothetical protein
MHLDLILFDEPNRLKLAAAKTATTVVIVADQDVFTDLLARDRANLSECLAD